MTDTPDHDLLVRLVNKLEMFYEEFRRVSNGSGFPRCAERLNRITTLERDLQTAHKRLDALKTKLWWAVTTSLTTLVGFIASLALELFKR